MARAAVERDVLVIGGGPAGSTAAHLLASWGRSVTLVQRPPAAHLTLAESLPASTRKLLQFNGQLSRVDAAGFYPNTGNRAEWAGATRVTTSTDAGYHVPRAAFDRVLLDSARAAGATIVSGSVQRVEIDSSIRADGTDDRGRAIDVRAQYVLDCSGRAGVIARREWRRTTSSYRTLAIVAEWECEDWPADERTYTTIESYADGWAWSVPLSATRRQCTVMVEKERSGARPLGRLHREGSGRVSEKGSRPLFRVYADELAKAATLAARLAPARRVSDPWTCDASLYDCARAADGPVLLVGDAASFIEPLSSAGVKKALLSAWRAAVVANTCLTNPSMAGPARDLFTQREHAVHVDCLRRSSAFFAEAATAYGTQFWSTRAAHAPHGGEAGADDDAADPSDTALAHDDSIRAAFERLRREDGVRLRPADALQFTTVPTIDGREVVMREALVVPGLSSPLHYAAGIDLARLARIAARCDDVPAIIAAYQDDGGVVPLAGVLTGLSLLVARRALVAEDRHA